MLAVKRRLHQRIVIDGGRIVVEVVEIRRNWARIGVSAPADVRVDREEVHLDKVGTRPLSRDEARCLGQRLLHSTVRVEDALAGLRCSAEEAVAGLSAVGVARCRRCGAWRKGDDCDCLPIGRRADRWLEQLQEAGEAFRAAEDHAEAGDEALRAKLARVRVALARTAAAVADVSALARGREVGAA